MSDLPIQLGVLSPNSISFASSQLREVFAAHPFHIHVLECCIKLSPFDGIANGQRVRIQPTLLYHKDDMRNLVSVRDWETQTNLDYMRSYDLVDGSAEVPK